MKTRNLAYILLLGVLSFSSFATEESVSLNGLWEIQVRSERLEETPPSTGWEATPIRIPSAFNGNGFTNGNGPDYRHFPSYPESWDEALAAWHRREILIPQGWTDGRIVLRFEASHLHTVVYLNAIRLGESDDGFLPFEFDLTGLVSPGQVYTVTAGVESSLLLGEGEFGRIPAPHGSFWGRENAGIWQDVSLLRRPVVRMGSPKIETSVRDATASLTFEVLNDTGLALSPRIAYQILEASSGEMIRTGETSTISVSSSDSATREVRFDWPEAHLWSPDDPFLYHLETRLLLGEREIDSATVRFGFREFELVEGKFYLNGIRTHLRADSWHWMGISYQDPRYAREWIALAKESNLNCIRLHAQVYPKFYLDLADEMGILIVGESAHWGSAADLLYTDNTWQRLREQWEKILMRDRNHPSIIMWSLANEIIPGSNIDIHDDLDGMEEYQTEMSAVIDRVNHLDGTRPLYAEGDFDGFGLFDVISFHYPGPQFGPSLDFWRNLDTAVSIGEAGPMFYVEPKDVCNWRGPSTYLSYEGMQESTADNLTWLIENYRLWAEHIAPFNLIWYGLEPLEFAGDPIEYDNLETPGAKPERIGPYSRTLNAENETSLPESILNPVGRAIQESMKPVALIASERDTRFFGNSTVDRDLYAVNDLPRSVTFTCDWKFELAGETIEEDTFEFLLEPAADLEFSLPLTLPSVAEVESGSFRIRLYENEVAHASKESSLQVWPETIDVGSVEGNDLVVFDPHQMVSLDRLGLTDWTLITGPSLIPPSTGQILLVGPQAGLDDKGRGDLLQFIRQGGRALVLEDNPEALPSYAGQYESVSPELPFSWFAYLNGNHPITTSIDENDLRNWGSDNALLSGWTRDLAMGNAKTPLVSGCGGAVLIDLPLGEGRMVVSHLKMGELSSTQPVAAQLLANSLNYLQTSNPISVQTATVFGPQDSELVDFLVHMGVVFDFVTAPSKRLPPNGEATLIDASNSDWFLEIGIEILDDITESGSQQESSVVVWNLDEAGADALAPVLSREIEVVDADHPFLIPQGNLMEGVYPETTYWIESEVDTVSVVQAGMRIGETISSREDYLVAPLFDWRSFVFEAETTRTSAILRSQRENPPARISGLSAYTIGKTRFILCWLRTELFPKNLSLVSTFLTNLDIQIDPFLPTPDLVPDGLVDWRDLFVFSKGWFDPLGTTLDASRSDFSRDGKVNAPDLLQFLGEWNEELIAGNPVVKHLIFLPRNPNSKAEIMVDRQINR